MLAGARSACDDDVVFALPRKEVLHCLLEHFAAGIGNRLGQRNVLGADFNAILRVAAFLNPAIAHQGL